MLQGFRGFINSIVGKVFFTALLLTFSLLGVGYGFRDLVLGATKSTDAANVGGDVITLNQLQADYRRLLQNQQRRLGAAFNPSPQEKLDIAQGALDQDINDALLTITAQRDGFRVSDGMLRDIIQSEPAFAGPDGRFDPAHFRMMLESQGQSEPAFVASIRGDIAKQLVINPVAGSASAPKMLADDLYRYRNEKRVAETVTLPDSGAGNVPPPTDAQLETYYHQHEATYTAPEYRTFTVLSLSPDEFASQIHPSDDDVRAAYDQHKAEYVDPEKRKITQVVLNDQATADQVAKLARSGKSLADAAKAVTGGKSQAISLDALARNDFPEALREPVFTAAKGAVSGPVQTTLGWHVFQVTDIQPGHEVPFDDVKAKLTAQLKHDGAADLLAGQIDKIGDRLSGGATMDSVADGVGAKPASFGPIDAKGGLPPGSKTPADATPPNPLWLAEAFTEKSGDTSPFIDAPDGSYFAVRLDSVTPPALRPLNDVRADLVATWTAEQKAAQVTKRAEDLAAKARAGTPMAQIATEAGAKLQTTPPLLRDPLANKVDAAPPALITALFKLAKIGDVAVVNVGDAEAVIRLSQVQQADPTAAGTDLVPLEKELDAAVQADDLAQYRAGLRQEVKVKVNPDAVATVVGQ